MLIGTGIEVEYRLTAKFHLRKKGEGDVKHNKMATSILIAMVLGIIAGEAVNTFASDALMKQQIAHYFSLGASIFLRLIKMIIAPLVFSTLVAGIGRMSDSATIGRTGAKALIWFFGASLFSLSLGLILVNLFAPGSGMHRLADLAAIPAVSSSAMSLDTFVKHVVPESGFKALADNEILQIVVFSIFVGIACASQGQKARPVIVGIESFSQVILKVTTYIMHLAPVAVFFALAATVSTNGMSVLVTYGKFMGEFYVALALLWAVLIAVGFMIFGKLMKKLISLIREPFLIALSTSTSEAAYPLLLERLERFGVPKRIAAFVLPLGYSFNLDGTMMYCTFATVFIAQAYDIALPWSTQIAMLLTLMLTSKGIAGVPRASFVVIAATLTQFKLPQEGVLLILGVDSFLDMGRSATNVVGNALAAAVVAKWEKVWATDDAEKSSVV